MPPLGLPPATVIVAFSLLGADEEPQPPSRATAASAATAAQGMRVMGLLGRGGRDSAGERRRSATTQPRSKESATRGPRRAGRDGRGERPPSGGAQAPGRRRREPG